VTDLGSIPQHSICSGTFEPEGVDYDTATGVLRIEITQPGVCEVAATVYEYQQKLAGLVSPAPAAPVPRGRVTPVPPAASPS
jgi:hypothetical protein